MDTANSLMNLPLISPTLLALPSITAIIPAFNEAPAIAQVVQGLLQLRACDGTALIQQVIVADNASSDETAALAQAAGARVVFEGRRGYGYACMAAMQSRDTQHHANEQSDRHDLALAQSEIDELLLFVDGDHSVIAEEVPLLLQAWQAGAELVIGARVHRHAGAMTFPQRFGNALACYLSRLIWRVPMTDLGPFRLIRRSDLMRIKMEDMTYGWTIEMQLKAFQLGMRVVEVPVTVQARIGVSKVSGTVRGVIGAAIGIFSMIGKLWWRQLHQPAQFQQASSNASDVHQQIDGQD